VETARKETVYLGDTPIAVLAGTAIYNIHTDQLNTPRLLTAAVDGTVAWSWDPEPFGNSQPSGTLTFNLRFPGQYHDKETGLYHNGFRDYDPSTGRYIESDPIGLAGGLNTYSYVGGNPLDRVDPHGLLDPTPWPAPVPVTVPAAETGIGRIILGGALGAFGVGVGLLMHSSDLDDDSPIPVANPTPPPEKPKEQCKDDDGDDCKQKASDWELKQAGINAHEVKKGLGQVSLFELCKCKSGGFAVKRKGCQGPIIFRL
jgi:RHS repeat-associated protein